MLIKFKLNFLFSFFSIFSISIVYLTSLTLGENRKVTNLSFKTSKFKVFRFPSRVTVNVAHSVFRGKILNYSVIFLNLPPKG